MPQKQLSLIDAYFLALKIRNFEIKLFWQRALFFGGFISILFIAYYKINRSDLFVELLILSLGVLFSLAWSLANRGSKYWYEAWESKIGLIESELGTNLISVWQKPQGKNCLYKGRLYSVSKITIFLSDTIFVSWLLLFSNKLLNATNFGIGLLFLLFLAIASCLLLICTRTNVPDRVKVEWGD